MVKKFSTIALAALIALPAVASAGSGDIASQIDRLTMELEKLRQEMSQIKEKTAENEEDLEERASQWDMASRFQWSGDFRTRYDYYSRDRKTFVASGAPADATVTDTNSSLMTNRLRLNMRVKATEDLEFKGRLAMYKAWGNQSTPTSDGLGAFSGFPGFDGNATRTPDDSALYVDRAFINWNNIGGQPIWFSIGRRPTTDGAPSHLKLGADKKMATPSAYMDWAFDGLSLGYAYENLFGMEDAPGRVRFCWGRGFENGLNQEDTSYTNDTDFAGISWDVYKKGNRFAYFQSFAALDVFNFPDWADDSDQPAAGRSDARRMNIGNIYHTSGTYMSKYQNLNYFTSVGWSRTDPNEMGMLNDYTAPGVYATPNTDDEDGYHVLLGLRYDMPEHPFKFGLEYGHGTENWIAMNPGHDDMYAAKLATRGNTYEAYTIWDIPAGEAISKFGKAFMRLGYIHYDYEYTGSMDWNVKAYDVDAADAFKANFAGQDVIEDADQVYLTMEAWF